MARPDNPHTVRTPELADALVEGISNGIPLRELCREHGVGKSTMYNWFDEDKELAGRIACARVKGWDELAEQCLEIADDGRRDYIVGEDGVGVVNSDHIQRSRLRIETRLKLLAKWDPKRYGDKVQQEHSSPDGTMTPRTEMVVRFVGAGERTDPSG